MNQTECSKATSSHKELELEYSQTNENFRKLADIRFKLLTFIPTLGGVAVFALSFLGLSLKPAQIGTDSSALCIVILISIFGFMASLALTIYDQRNSELYNALIHRAKYLEELFESANSPGTRRQRKFGGQFQERPKKARFLFGKIKMGHDLALSLIYGSVLGAWFFPISVAGLQLVGVPKCYSFPIATVITLLTAVIFIRELQKQDREDYKRWVDAAERDSLEEYCAGARKSEAGEL